MWNMNRKNTSHEMREGREYEKRMESCVFALLLLLLIIPAAIVILLLKDPAGGHLDRSMLKSDLRENQKLLSIHTEKEQVEDLLNKELRKRRQT